MANPAVTYTFVNGNVADASQVNQNFTDIINSLIDGTKSLNIDAITAAGTATLNGDTVIGSSSSDLSTVNATLSFATTPKVDTIAEKTSAAGVTIDGVLLKDNTVTASGGLIIGNETLSVYDEGSFTIYATDGTSNASFTAYYTKVGKLVTLNIPTNAVVSSANTGSDYIYLSSSSTPATLALPTGLIPTNTCQCFTQIQNGATYVRGVAKVLASPGGIQLWTGPAGEGFVAGTSNKGAYNLCISYIV